MAAIRAAMKAAKKATWFDRAELFHLARLNYSRWMPLEAEVRDWDRGSWPEDCRRRFRRAAVVAAYCDVRNLQSLLRAFITWSFVGLGGSMAFWSIFWAGAARLPLFLVTSVVVIALSTILSLPYLFGTAPPVPLLVTATTGATLGLALLWMSGSVTAALSATVPAGAEVGVAFLVFAASCLIGTLCLGATFVLADAIVERRRYDLYSLENLIVFGSDLLDVIRDSKPGLTPSSKREVIVLLERMTTCLRGASRSFSLAPAHSRQLVADRFEQAAQAVSECQAWVVLEQPATLNDLRRVVARTVMAVVTGYFHELPQPLDPGGNAERHTPLRTFLRVGRELVVGVSPVLVVAALPWLGLNLPVVVTQWVTGLALLWLATRVIGLFDPARALTPRDIQEMIRAGSGR